MEDYEKKYKELVGKIDKAYLYAQTDSTKAVLEEIRPELKESEDEKIRKAIRYAIGQSTHSDGTLINGVSSEEALAWLEKQGEQKYKEAIERAKTIDKREYGDIISTIFPELELCAYPTTKPFISDLQDLFPELAESEDEKKFSDILAILRGGENCYYNSPALIDWLKSLIHQNRRKPSDEQMQAFKEAVDAEIVEVEDDSCSIYPHTHLEICTDEDLSKICKAGDKAKVIIIKQEEDS